MDNHSSRVLDLKEKFKDLKRATAVEEGRSAYYYATSVVDTKATALTLVAGTSP